MTLSKLRVSMICGMEKVKYNPW